MRALAGWGATALLAAPLGARALGLGDIELQSALNQPLRAEIALVSATPEELEGLRVALAPRETFARYGLDRPEYLSRLQFSVSRDASGRSVVRVSSRESIAEPFVTMLIEATWPRGRLLREYTVLLDPPVLLPAPAAAEPVRPAQSRPSEATVPGGAIARSTPQAAPVEAPRPAPASVTPAPRLPAEGTTGTYGPVQRAETLWGIAERYRPAGVSMNQMMVAIYQANPQAFDGNMNLLLRGAVLTIPAQSRVQAMTTGDATAEVQRQLTAWQGGQQRLRLLPPTDGPEAATRGVAAAPSASAAAANTAETQRLQGEVQTLRSELEESRRLLELRDQQLRDLQEQLSARDAAGVEPATQPVPAEPEPAATPGVDLELEPPLFADELEVEQAPADIEPLAGATDPLPAVEPSAEPAAATPPSSVQTPVIPAVTSSPPEPSLMARALEWVMNPVLLIGAGVVAFLLAAFLFYRRRRTDPEDVTGRWEALEAEVDDEEIREATTRMRRQVPDDGSFLVEEQPARRQRVEPELSPAAASARAAASPPVALSSSSDETLSSQTVINLDQADPVAEADFHMAYGLYDQAAELISKALEADPRRRDLKLKLLEVFFVWGNKDSFLTTAESLREEMGAAPDADWDKVVIMGKQICPDEALFADATAAAAEVDVDLDAGASPALDLAFDEAEAGIDLDFSKIGGESEAEDELDDFMKLEATGGTRGRSADRGRAPDFGESGLDIGERTAAGLEAALLFDNDDDVAARTAPDIDPESLAMTDADTLGTSDDDGLAVTQESPTVERPHAGSALDWSDITVESPTQELSASDAPTMETPTVESPAPEAPTVETPTIESPFGGGARSALDALDMGASGEEGTAEIDLDDLGLDVEDLQALPSDLGDLPGDADDGDGDAVEQTSVVDDNLLSATGVTQVLMDDDEFEQRATAVLSDNDATMMTPSFDDDDEDDAELTGTAILEQRFELDAGGETSLVRSLNGGDDGLDLNLDDLSAALRGGDTVEQPRASMGGDIFSGNGGTPIDLDVGFDLPSDDSAATEEVSPLDPQTMTEVGTKLDLARAYIDMGDPEGARSILEEVLDEGDPGQRREAQGLIDALTA